ncbi:MAG: LytTR family DNA-binding domain-containing protein [Sediminibacterium sp.]
MKAIIIEDEVPLAIRLQTMLARHSPQIEILGMAHHADDAIAMIRALKPELLFLDIQLPKRSAFDMLAALGAYDFEVIFVTAYDHYAIQAIKVSALDYLLKPVRSADLRKAVAKAEMVKAKSQTAEQIQNLLTVIKHTGITGQRIALSMSKELKFVNPDEIIRVESTNNYATFYLTNKEKPMVSKGLYHWEELLTPYQFIRCHQSHLVNRKHLKTLKRDLSINELVLSDGSTVPVSKGYLDKVKQGMEFL